MKTILQILTIYVLILMAVLVSFMITQGNWDIAHWPANTRGNIPVIAAGVTFWVVLFFFGISGAED